MFLRCSLLTFFMAVCPMLQAETVLDRYVEEGLRKNLSLLGKEYGLRESIARVKEAWGRFFPALSVEARTTWNWGGRTMTLPVGQFVNPLYALHGFPGIPENYDISLLPADDQEIALKITQPIFVPSLFHNLAVQELLRESAELENLLARRFITAEIKRAYFTFLKAERMAKVFEKAAEALDENLRVSEALFRKGMVTEDVVFRARAEIAGIGQKKLEAENAVVLSRSYFNFLLQRPDDAPVETVPVSELVRPVDFSLEQATGTALSLREELLMLARGKKTQEELALLHMHSYLPAFFAALECGFFADNFEFSLDRYFVSFSLLVRWEAFDGFQAASRAEQAGYAARKKELEYEEARGKIRMEVQQAYNDLLVAEKAITAASDQLESIGKYYVIVEKKYREGLIPQAEYLEAQSRFSRAEAEKAVAEYDFCIKYALFESISLIGNRDRVSSEPGTAGGDSP